MLRHDLTFLHLALGAKVVLGLKKIITTDQTRNNLPFKMEQ